MVQILYLMLNVYLTLGQAGKYTDKVTNVFFSEQIACGYISFSKYILMLKNYYKPHIMGQLYLTSPSICFVDQILSSLFKHTIYQQIKKDLRIQFFPELSMFVSWVQIIHFFFFFLLLSYVKYNMAGVI